VDGTDVRRGRVPEPHANEVGSWRLTVGGWQLAVAQVVSGFSRTVRVRPVNQRMVGKRAALVGTCAVLLCAAPAPIEAQRGGRGNQAAAPPNARATAPIDLTGYWVSLVTDDWRYRMVTPPKGNVDFLPVNAAARRVAESWDPARDEATGEQCKGYGAVGVMRLPGRLQITWENDNTLRIDTDTGTQTRRFSFGAPAPTGAPTWQGYSVAQWEFPGGARGRGAPPQPGAAQLKVVTTRLRPGYLRKNGIPYGANATLTEYFVRLTDDDGTGYMAVTAMVEDPEYLVQPFIRTVQFKKLPDETGWNPTPCSAR